MPDSNKKISVPAFKDKVREEFEEIQDSVKHIKGTGMACILGCQWGGCCPMPNDYCIQDESLMKRLRSGEVIKGVIRKGENYGNEGNEYKMTITKGVMGKEHLNVIK